MDPWVLRAVQDEIRRVERDRDEMLKDIQFHQEQVDWRQAAVETAIERIAALRAHVSPLACENCGKSMAEHGPMADCWPGRTSTQFDGCIGTPKEETGRS